MSQVALKELQQKTDLALQQSYQVLNKQYLATLEDQNIRSLSLYEDEKINLLTDVRLFQVERLILENKQSMLESLTATYATLGAAGFSVFLLLESDGKETTVYLGTKGKAKAAIGNVAGKLLTETLSGHFSGSSIVPVTEKTVKTVSGLIGKIGSSEDSIITAVSSVPSLSLDEREHFMQGLEHFIDAAEGRVYQALILAEPVSPKQLDLIQRGYEETATQLSPLLKTSLSYGENESDTIGISISESISESLGTSLGLTETAGTSNTLTDSVNQSTSHTESETESTSVSTTASYGTPMGGPGGSVSQSYSKSFSVSNTLTQGTSHSMALGTSQSTSNSKTESKTDTYGTTTGQNIGRTVGSSKQRSLEFVNKTIEQMLKKVDHNLERIEEARRYGGWHSAAYFISDNLATSQSLASIFFGLMRGNNSSSEEFALTTWRSDKIKKVSSWLQNLSHPRVRADSIGSTSIPYFTPAMLVSGKEMAIQLGLPRRSISTVSVLEGRSFGRRIQVIDAVGQALKQPTDKPIVKLGNVFHLWEEKQQKVNLDLQSLSSHIFVTGSTGSGKSNTVYQLLDQLNQNGVKFMVIEPAKGEYKNVFGHREDVTVLGTNPKQAQLLKLNPFKFPAEVHILEHIDRLIEIFNVCWPMYAAMPAVLKDAMLSAYEVSGWNLSDSESKTPHRFPTFIDLLHQLNVVIDKSEYSAEMKSNYSGALATRIKSLTNGLNGQIFSADEIDNQILFDENVIVDLSRVGSQETKSLIMGLLVMRLSEHRMANASGMNEPLKHVTVLEEAHNILKASTSSGAEGADVAGKSVEMLSNAIAEMRTYGEGFIIADQSPNAVDISAIRNTNTKIIMRLPDENDRRLAAKAAGVSDEQIEEIAKLPKGVAVVYQNNWLEPILCKIAYFDSEEKPYIFEKSEIDERKNFALHLARFLLHKQLPEDCQFDLNVIKNGVDRFCSSAKAAETLMKYVYYYELSNKLPFWDNAEMSFKALLEMFDLQKIVSDRFLEINLLEGEARTREFNQLVDFINEHLAKQTEATLVNLEPIETAVRNNVLHYL